VASRIATPILLRQFLRTCLIITREFFLCSCRLLFFFFGSKTVLVEATQVGTPTITLFVVASSPPLVSYFIFTCPLPLSPPSRLNISICISDGGKSVNVKVVDRCTACDETSLDFSPAAFEKLANQDVGRLYGMTWTWS
jgi:Lytic transglycolase